jgi:hypothetical protein
MNSGSGLNPYPKTASAGLSWLYSCNSLAIRNCSSLRSVLPEGAYRRPCLPAFQPEKHTLAVIAQALQPLACASNERAVGFCPFGHRGSRDMSTFGDGEVHREANHGSRDPGSHLSVGLSTKYPGQQYWTHYCKGQLERVANTPGPCRANYLMTV